MKEFYDDKNNVSRDALHSTTKKEIKNLKNSYIFFKLKDCIYSNVLCNKIEQEQYIKLSVSDKIEAYIVGKNFDISLFKKILLQKTLDLETIFGEINFNFLVDSILSENSDIFYNAKLVFFAIFIENNKNIFSLSFDGSFKKEELVCIGANQLFVRAAINEILKKEATVDEKEKMINEKINLIFEKENYTFLKNTSCDR